MKDDITQETSFEGRDTEHNVSHQYYHQDGSTDRQCQYFISYFISKFGLVAKKNITKNRKLYIYQTIIQNILVYGAEVWQIPTREMNKILSTEMDVLRRSARKSRRERIKNEHMKEIMGVKGKQDIMDIIQKKRLQWYGHVKRMPEERIPKLIMEWTSTERRKRGRPRKTWTEPASSHCKKELRTRSMEKERGMEFGFRKTATAVMKPDRL